MRRPITLWRAMPEPTGQEPAAELAEVLAVARQEILELHDLLDLCRDWLRSGDHAELRVAAIDRAIGARP